MQSASSGRIPHAQLFVGPEGCGTLPMAIAYAQYVLCLNSGMENSGGNESCNLKFQTLSHPDLHFIYPNVANEDVKSKPKSADFIADWRAFVLKNPYGSLFDWYKHLGVEKKQGMIRVEDAQDILKSLALKSYEGGYKVMIVWMVEKMNIEASNKLLKLLEEPPDKTLFILISENEEDIIQTIRSRCQVLHFGALPEAVIAKAMREGRFHRNRAIELMVETGFGRPSASFYLSALQIMPTGETYKKTISNGATRYYLQRFMGEMNVDEFVAVLRSVAGHIRYYNA